MKKDAAKAKAKHRNGTTIPKIWRAFMILAAVLCVILSGCSDTSTPADNQTSQNQTTQTPAPEKEQPPQEQPTKKHPTEEQMKEDLQNNNMPPEHTVTDLSIIKSQTDEEAGTYTAYVQVSVTTEWMKLSEKYKMEYVKYDQGWFMEKIETYEPGTETFEPLRGLTEEELRTQYLRCYGDGTGEILSNTVDLEACTQIVEYRYTEVHELCTLEKTDRIVFTFQDYMGGCWSNTETQTISCEETWDIVGKKLVWSDSEYNEYYIVVSSFDTNSMTAKISVFHCDKMKGYTESSGGYTQNLRHNQGLDEELKLDTLCSMYGIKLSYIIGTSMEDMSAKTDAAYHSKYYPYVFEVPEPWAKRWGGPGSYSYLDYIHEDWGAFEASYEQAARYTVFVGYDSIVVSSGIGLTDTRELTVSCKILTVEDSE